MGRSRNGTPRGPRSGDVASPDGGEGASGTPDGGQRASGTDRPASGDAEAAGSEDRNGRAVSTGDRDARPTDGRDRNGGSVSGKDRDVGTIVGKAENVLLPTFILAEAYTALSVIFAAKGLVRREDIRKDTLYYLGCTMTNVTYSVAVGFAVRLSLEALGVGQIAFL